jgi:hypothetical protein
MACAALTVLVAANSLAQESAAPAKDTVTDAAIIAMCGGGQAKMFALYGVPEDLWATRGATEDEDDVFLGYGAYGFKVRDKVVRVCFFFRGWKGPIRGIKIGDSCEDVAKALGNPRTTVKAKDGSITAYGYQFQDLDANFFANFKDGKVWRVEVSLK